MIPFKKNLPAAGSGFSDYYVPEDKFSGPPSPKKPCYPSDQLVYHKNTSQFFDRWQYAKKSINTCYPQKTLAFQPHTTDIWSCCKIEFWSVMLPMWGFYVLWRREEIFKIFQGTAPLPDKALFGSGSTLCKYRTWLRVENLTFRHWKVIFC